MVTFFDVLAMEIARQAAERYGTCREDAKVKEDEPYYHPPVIHFSKTFTILPGAVESLTIDGLKNREHRFASIDGPSIALLEKCTGLKELSLVYVQLDSFTGIPRLPLLKSLNMQGNQIDSFKGLLHQVSLVELNLWGNLVKGFKFFPCLPQLRELNASCNRITGQLARLVARAPKLQVLRLALNPISDEAELMPLEQLSELQHLELYGCPVARQLLDGDSAWLRRLRARGVRVLLQQSSMPVEMMRQLQQMQKEHHEQQITQRVGCLPSIVVNAAQQ
ncbi:hypothetical protein ACSSS7_000962 [Eimeria intestinalis]